MRDSDHNQTHLKLKPLKEWAKANLPLNSTLRAVLLQEAETMVVEEFLAKFSTWTTLAHLEDQSKIYRRKRFG